MTNNKKAKKGRPEYLDPNEKKTASGYTHYQDRRIRELAAERGLCVAAFRRFVMQSYIEQYDRAKRQSTNSMKGD